MRRPKVDDAQWHVTSRGARRLPLFHEDADFKVFYALLGNCCLEAGIDLVADCLMSNHFHLALRASSSALTRCMLRLNRAYSSYHNQRYDLSGHAFDQAYYACILPSPFILQRVVRYIHLNPVRSGQVGAPERYSWSSYRRLVSAPGDVLTLPEAVFLRPFDPDLQAAQGRYRAFVEKDLHRPVAKRLGRTTAWELWQEYFSWILEDLIARQDFIAPLEPESVAVHFGSRIGIPPRAMGRFLGHPNGRQVSEMLRAIHRRMDQSPSLRAKLDSLQIL